MAREASRSTLKSIDASGNAREKFVSAIPREIAKRTTQTAMNAQSRRLSRSMKGEV